ncbi:MAG: hypothetical protein FWF22_06350, partial [Treponema sp.]|nr:hypothetical protein [Treponema sp.]
MIPFISLMAAAAVSALGFTLSLPNEFLLSGFPPGGFICLVPLFYALGETKSWREGALLGFVFGLVFHAASCYWLANFKDYAVWTLGATAILYACFYGFWAVLLRYAAIQKNEAGSLLLAVIWTLTEWQKSTGYFGFPWGLLPYTVQNVPVLIQSADTSGVYGIGFMLALFNAVFARFIRTGIRGFSLRKFPALLSALVILLCTSGYGIWSLSNPVPVLRRIPVVLVQ